MTGVWVVYFTYEGWGGFDRIFQTETDARLYHQRPLDDTWVRLNRTIKDRDEVVAFVPFGSYAAHEPEEGRLTA